MKRHITYLISLLVALLQSAQGSTPPAAPVTMGPHQSGCSETSDNGLTNTSTSIRVTIVSCSGGDRIIVDRKVDHNSVVTQSKRFSIDYAGLNELRVIDKNNFYVNYLQSRSYSNPSIIIYSFHFQNKKWRLQEMSFQASHSCNDEAGVDADYYEINYQTGKVEAKEYAGCDHYTARKSNVKPALILLEEFDPSDDRLSPFKYN
jgi:hypothetical protein